MRVQTTGSPSTGLSSAADDMAISPHFGGDFLTTLQRTSTGEKWRNHGNPGCKPRVSPKTGYFRNARAKVLFQKHCFGTENSVRSARQLSEFRKKLGEFALPHKLEKQADRNSLSPLPGTKKQGNHRNERKPGNPKSKGWRVKELLSSLSAFSLLSQGHFRARQE